MDESDKIERMYFLGTVSRSLVPVAAQVDAYTCRGLDVEEKLETLKILFRQLASADKYMA